MNLSKSTTIRSLEPTAVNCAVIHAGREVALALEARPGRYPVQVIQVSPVVQWLGADGILEQLVLREPFGEADRERLADEIRGDGLLVCEFVDMETALDVQAPISHWLMGAAPHMPRERAA